jgi:hypothetical protein
MKRRMRRNTTQRTHSHTLSAYLYCDGASLIIQILATEGVADAEHRLRDRFEGGENGNSVGALLFPTHIYINISIHGHPIMAHIPFRLSVDVHEFQYMKG